MQLQSADVAGGCAVRPAGAADRDPLSGQRLKGAVGGLQLRGLTGMLGRQRADSIGSVFAQFGSFLSGCLAVDAGVATQSQLAPLACGRFVAQLPRLSAIGLDAQIQALAVQLSIGGGLGLQPSQGCVAEWPAFDFAVLRKHTRGHTRREVIGVDRDG